MIDLSLAVADGREYMPKDMWVEGEFDWQGDLYSFGKLANLNGVYGYGDDDKFGPATEETEGILYAFVLDNEYGEYYVTSGSSTLYYFDGSSATAQSVTGGEFKLVDENYSSGNKYSLVVLYRLSEDANTADDSTLPEEDLLDKYQLTDKLGTYAAGDLYIPYKSESGRFIKPSDFSMEIKLYDLELQYGIEKSQISIRDEGGAVTEVASGVNTSEGGKYTYSDVTEFNKLDELKLNLAFEGTFEVNADALDESGVSNTLDLSWLFALLLGEDSSLGSTSLTIRIGDDLDLTFKIGIYIYLDLQDFSKTEVVLKLEKLLDDGSTEDFLSIFIAPDGTGKHSIYANLYFLLGDQGKVAITNFDLAGMLDGVLG